MSAIDDLIDDPWSHAYDDAMAKQASAELRELRDAKLIVEALLHPDEDRAITADRDGVRLHLYGYRSFQEMTMLVTLPLADEARRALGET